MRGSQRTIGIIVAVVIGVVALGSAYYQVEPDEVALVTRFGRFVRTSNPGPHTKIPFGVPVDPEVYIT